MSSVTKPRRRSTRVSNALKRTKDIDTTVYDIGDSDSDQPSKLPETTTVEVEEEPLVQEQEPIKKRGRRKRMASRPKNNASRPAIQEEDPSTQEDEPIKKKPKSVDYEARRLLTIQENNDKLKALGVPRISKTINDSMASTSKGKDKAVEDEDGDGEYRPGSDSAEDDVDGDDDQEDEPTTTVEVPIKKRGMHKKTKATIDDDADTTTEPQHAATTPKRMTKSALLASKGLSGIPSKIPTASSIADLKRKKEFRGPRTLHWETLEQLKVDDQFKVWLTPVWKNFFSIVEPAYDELVFEFFSSYKFNKNTDDVDSKAMYFRLRGKEFSLSFKQFATAMELYSDEEVLGEAFQSGITTWPTDASPSEFWNKFGAGPYHKNLSCTSITIPSYKILHRAISESINQRGSCTNLVTLDDLFYMYCIVNNTPCNLAKCLARYLYKSTGKSDTSAVCGGAYITKLALGLGAVTKADLLKMQVLAKTSLFDEVLLRKLEIIEKDHPLRFVEHGNDAAKDNTDDASRFNAVEGEVRAIKEELNWVSEGLHYLIQKLGHSFEPPPHVKARVQASDQNTLAAHDTANKAGPSSNPSLS